MYALKTAMEYVARLQRGFIKLSKNSRANVAILFALASIPIAGFIATGVEIARITNAKQQLQAATDAAAIDNTTNGRGSDADAVAYAKNFVKASIGANAQVGDITIGKYTENGTEMMGLVVDAKLDSIFAGVIGIDKFDIKTSSGATAAMGPNEIVFVLDTTGSMAQNNRMVNLKAAVKNVLSQLQPQSANGNVKVGIVPFNTMVKMQPSTSYNNVNYGSADTWYGCDSTKGSTSWPSCWVAFAQRDAMCKNATNRVACNDNAVYYETKVTWSGSNATYYQVAKSYEMINGKYTIYVQSAKWSYYGGSCNNSYTDETGYHCSSSNSSEKLTNESYTVYTNQANLSNYNSNPGAQYTKMPNYMTYIPALSNGFAGTYEVYGNSNDITWNYTNYNSSTQRKGFHPATPDHKDLWTGCIYDRDQPHDTDAAEAKPGDKSTWYTARLCDYEPLETVMGLTTDFDALNAKVDALKPAGNTNITIGLQFAMEVLSPSLPYSDGAAFSDKSTRKTIILVTDGANTKNRWTSSASTINARTKLACQNAKDLGITMFVIKLEEGDDSLLEGCATKPPYYFDLTGSSQIGAALQSVLQSMGETRITR